MNRFSDDMPTSSKIKFDSDDDDEQVESASDDDEKNEINEVLANVTFEELQKARSDGSHVINQKPKLERKGKRENKNRPMEISSKKPVGRFREVIQAPKKVIRDPRFESLCGTLDEDGFKKRYNFLYDDEKKRLEEQMERTKNPEVLDGLKGQLAWINKQLKAESTKHISKEILVKHKKKEREAAKQGKQPYYLKKSEIRKQQLAEKFKELKASGKLNSFIEKKRKKNAAKDHKFMPYRRPNDNQQEN
uniref:ribosomal RNA processing protein 36 homolog n=1 Tax=Erigeron canadensis TaxID=72917 RepID=UPI001CB8CD46|nr:ribosomal RNA processing protein 36 homolog [Erigeron canadensis]